MQWGDIEYEHVIPLKASCGVSANTRLAWSIANARRIIGYEPQDDSEVVYADEIRELMLEPTRAKMFQGQERAARSFGSVGAASAPCVCLNLTKRQLLVGHSEPLKVGRRRTHRRAGSHGLWAGLSDASATGAHSVTGCMSVFIANSPMMK
jgi:hypothetical protein